jgi:hypothetical protein
VSTGWRYRSFFWPAVLILVGILALLVNTGALSADRLFQLVDLWPLILIVAGLELIARRSLQGRSRDLAGALIAVVAVGAAVAYLEVAPAPGGLHSLDASAPAGQLDHASVQIDVGGATITVRGSGDLGGDLYRAHIDYSGSRPEVRFDSSSGALRIAQSDSGPIVLPSRHFVLDLTLSSSVAWAITGKSGSATNTFEMGILNITSIELNTGTSRDDISLGRPTGVVPVTIKGGALTVHVHRPADTAASLSVSGGVVSVDADGRQTHAVGAASYSTPDFATAADAYRIEVTGGACTVSLDKSSGSG